MSPWAHSPPDHNFWLKCELAARRDAIQEAAAYIPGDNQLLTNQLFLFPRENWASSAFRRWPQTLKSEIMRFLEKATSLLTGAMSSQGWKLDQNSISPLSTRNKTMTKLSTFWLLVTHFLTSDFLANHSILSASSWAAAAGWYFCHTASGWSLSWRCWTWKSVVFLLFFLLWDCLWHRCITPPEVREVFTNSVCLHVAARRLKMTGSRAAPSVWYVVPFYFSGAAPRAHMPIKFASLNWLEGHLLHFVAYWALRSEVPYVP